MFFLGGGGGLYHTFPRISFSAFSIPTPPIIPNPPYSRSEVPVCLWKGGVLHFYHHFLEMKLMCVWGGGGAALLSQFSCTEVPVCLEGGETFIKLFFGCALIWVCDTTCQIRLQTSDFISIAGLAYLCSLCNSFVFPHLQPNHYASDSEGHPLHLDEALYEFTGGFARGASLLKGTSAADTPVHVHGYLMRPIMQCMGISLCVKGDVSLSPYFPATSFSN